MIEDRDNKVLSYGLSSYRYSIKRTPELAEGKQYGN